MMTVGIDIGGSGIKGARVDLDAGELAALIEDRRHRRGVGVALDTAAAVVDALGDPGADYGGLGRQIELEQELAVRIEEGHLDAAGLVGGHLVEVREVGLLRVHQRRQTGLHGGADRAEVELERLDLDVTPETQLSQLRVGQQQVVEIAKAISCDARVLTSTNTMIRPSTATISISPVLSRDPRATMT